MAQCAATAKKGHCEEICGVKLPLLEDDWWYTEAPEDMPDDFL